MKRNMDKIREIMLYLEEHLEGDSLQSHQLPLVESDSDEDYKILSEHIELLVENDFIEVGKHIHMSGAKIFLIRRIKTKGHDFLDLIRNDTVWNYTKDRAKEVGGYSVSILTSIAKTYVFEKLGIPQE